MKDLKNLQEEHPFLSAMQNLLPQDGEGSLARIRKKGWDLFRRLGIPTRKSEAFQYLKLRGLLHGDYLPTKTESAMTSDLWANESAGARLLIGQGSYAPEYSQTEALPKGVIILPLSSAVNTYGTFLNNQWNRTLKEEKDPFAALNLAVHQEGLFIYIPPKTIVERPIQILHLLDNTKLATLASPRIHVFVGAGAEVTFIATHDFLSSHTAVNGVWEFAVEEGAQVQMIQESWGAQESSWSFEAVRAYLKRDAKFTCTHATDGSTATRFDYRMHLLGENSEAALHGLSLVKGKAEAHQHLLIAHEAPNCRSHQLFKGLLNDFSRISFEGKIYVHQAAQKTEAYQLNNNILLSDHAQAYSKPNLEIFADDVKASHGATIGQLDPEQEFYLLTRGFDRQAARSALIQGYCREVIEKIHVETIKHRWQTHVQSFFKP